MNMASTNCICYNRCPWAPQILHEEGGAMCRWSACNTHLRQTARLWTHLSMFAIRVANCVILSIMKVFSHASALLEEDGCLNWSCVHMHVWDNLDSMPTCGHTMGDLTLGLLCFWGFPSATWGALSSRQTIFFLGIWLGWGSTEQVLSAWKSGLDGQGDCLVGQMGLLLRFIWGSQVRQIQLCAHELQIESLGWQDQVPAKQFL